MRINRGGLISGGLLSGGLIMSGGRLSGGLMSAHQTKRIAQCTFYPGKHIYRDQIVFILLQDRGCTPHVKPANELI